MFGPDPVAPEERDALFEAARWAPSSYNEQPWRFAYAETREDRARFLEGLMDGNRGWAQNAPLLVFVTAKTHLARGGRPNAHAWFDCGAAWMSLSLQANRMGLVTHAMAGIDATNAAKIIGAPAGHEVVCAIAIGSRPEGPQENPSGRLPLAEIAREGAFPGGMA